MKIYNLIYTKHSLLVFLAGAVSAAAMAPIYFFPILFMTLPLLFQAIQEQNEIPAQAGIQSHKTGSPLPRGFRKAFLTGWLFGFGYHIAGLYWIGNALLVDGNQYWWAYPFAVIGLPFVLAFFTGLATLLFRIFCAKTKLQHKWQQLIIFAALFTVTEYARGFVFTGFPWNLFGYTWASDWGLPMLQSVSLFGIYGLTFLTILVACLPVIRFSQNASTKDSLFMLLCVVVFFGLGIWGSVRMEQSPTTYHDDVTLRLVQPNIAQKDKWKTGKLADHFDTLLTLSSFPSKTPLTAILWPETATSFYLNRDPLFTPSLDDIIPDQAVLIGGILDMEDSGNETRIYNRITVWDDKGAPVYHYNKSHLVPFGEYIPYAEYLPFNPVAAGALDFTAGNGIETVDILHFNNVISSEQSEPRNPPSHSGRFLHSTSLKDGSVEMTEKGKTIPPFSPLVCYEVLFPGRVALSGDQRPAWLFNATNDAWYGASSGPYQHLAIARTRAVEEGLPLVRVAGTGISAVVDPVGRITGKLALNTQGILDLPLPQKISPTLFSRIGD